ncbi:MAG: four helix bundle protein [Bacteroidota bacterium]
MLFSFQHLEVWQSARHLAKEVYSLTRAFPADERFGLTSQVRRAAVSICCNLSEGSGRNTSKDQMQFYIIAKASLMEVMNLVILATDFDYLSEQAKENLLRKGKRLESRIQALIRSRQ